MRVVGYRQQQIAEESKMQRVLRGMLVLSHRNFQANSIILSHHSYGQDLFFFFLSHMFSRVIAVTTPLRHRLIPARGRDSAAKLVIPTRINSVDALFFSFSPFKPQNLFMRPRL